MKIYRLNKNARESSEKLYKKLCDTKEQYIKEKAEIIKKYKADVKAWKNDLGEERRQKMKLEKKLEEKEKETVENTSTEIYDTPTMTDHIGVKDETLCSTCACPIVNYVPKYFLTERISPACDKCDDYSWMSDDQDLLANNIVTRKGFNHHPTSIASKNSSSDLNCLHNQQCIIRQPFPPPLPSLTPIVNEYSLYHVKIMAGELDWGSTCWYCMRIDCDNYFCKSCVWIKHFGELHGYPDINPSVYKEHL